MKLTYAEIRREVGRFLAIGPSASWDTSTADSVNDAIVRGCRKFYFPDAILEQDGPLVGHEWSFLQVDHEITLSPGVSSHVLPSDFVRITSRPSIDGSDYPLSEVSDKDLRDLSNTGGGEGFPQYYHISRTMESGSLEYQIKLYPVPSDTLLLRFEYLVSPPTPSDSQEPLITAATSEALLASILAAADEVLNYETQTEGKHLERFKTLLASAILADRNIGG